MKEDFTSRDVIIAGIVALTVIIIVCVVSFKSYESSKIEAEKTIQQAKIVEHESTERTEERSQFWQKLVPWGSDESEKGK